MNGPDGKVLDFSQMIQIGLRNIAVQDQVGEFSVAEDGDEPGCLEFFEMVREGSGAYGLALAHVGARDAAIPRADLTENLVAAGAASAFAVRCIWLSESTVLSAMILSVHYSHGRWWLSDPVWETESSMPDGAAYSEMLPVLLIFSCAGMLPAQDPFEIHIYEYEPMNRGEYSLEAHLNIVAQGTTMRDGSLLPTDHQTHLTLEPTAGLSPNFAIGLMFLNAWEPGYSPQFAGWRILPHIYAPESWKLPVRLGFVAEFSFQKTAYEENSRRVELRPILDKEFAVWQIVLNPVFERALHGPGVEHGWNFEPALLLRWKRLRFSPSLEYYGEIESISARPHAQPEVHQLFAGGDWQVKPGFSINLGTGFELGDRGPGVVLKSRFEWHWGSPNP